MEVDGGEISLTFAGRTRDSGFDLVSNRSGITSLCLRHEEKEDFSKGARIGYITTKVWRDSGNDGTKSSG